MELRLKSKSQEDTKKIAQILAKYLQIGDVVLLYGDLGAGKTTFTQGLASGLQIHEIVKSPTFNIVKSYQTGRIPFYHIDAYRLEGNKHEIGLQEYIQGDGVCVIEWPDYIAHSQDYGTITLHLQPLSANQRLLILTLSDDFTQPFKSEVAMWLIS